MTGIDKALQDRVNTYGTNPAALQQRYQQSQKLIDLLALQQVKSDMQNARNNIMASMQNNPNTIAAQRENEVLGMAKENVRDKVQATAGALSNKQRQQQAQMKKLMALANKVGPNGIGALANRQQSPQMNRQSPQMNRQSPQIRPPVNPAMTGISRAPAPNMQGMTRRAAQGGIIGFAGENTSYVPDLSGIPEENREEILQLLQGTGISGTSKEFKDQIVQNYIKNTSQAKLAYPPIDNTNPDYDPGNISQSIAHLVGDGGASLNKKVKDQIEASPLSETSITKNVELANKLAGLTKPQIKEFRDQYAGLKDLHASQLNPGRLNEDTWRQMLSTAATSDNPFVGLSQGRGRAKAQQDRAAQGMKGREINTYRDILGDIQDDKRKSYESALKVGELKSGQQTQSMLIQAGMTKTQIDGLTSDQQAFYKDKEISANKLMNEARINAQKAIASASDEVKLEVAAIHADIAEKNNKLVTDTNLKMKEMQDETARLSIYTNGVADLNRDKVKALENLDAEYQERIDFVLKLKKAITGNRQKDIDDRAEHQTSIDRWKLEKVIQKAAITEAFKNSLKALKVSLEGITVD